MMMMMMMMMMITTEMNLLPKRMMYLPSAVLPRRKKTRAVLEELQWKTKISLVVRMQVS